MSSPPPNPDTRPLPPGWIQQYNWQYNAWFYVNQREQPPRSSWEHPANLSQYTPPPGPPPPNRDFNRSPYGGGYNQAPPSSGYAPSYDQGGYGGAPGGGGYQGNYPPARESRGLFGFGSSRPPVQQQPVYEQAPPRKSGMGVGTAAALGVGGGLLGGMLLEEVIDHHDEREREEGYDQGYENGYDNGYDNGCDNNFDNGGGDFF